jgi:hypothetical protein
MVIGNFSQFELCIPKYPIASIADGVSSLILMFVALVTLLQTGCANHKK